MNFSVPTDFNDNEVSRMVPHIFLPRELPNSSSQAISQDEGNLLMLMRDCVIETQHTANIGCLRQVVKLFETWTDIQCQEILDADVISDAVTSLKPGESFALYIRAQNAGLLLSIPNDCEHDSTTAILSTFAASQKSEDVMSNAADLSAVYPSSSIHIPISHFLKSKTFSCQLSDLCAQQFNIALTKTHRKSTIESEIRDVADPLLISKLISATLTDQHSNVCAHINPICKTVRDHVNWHNSRLPFRRSGLWMTAKAVLQLCLVNALGEQDGTFLYKLVILRVIAYCCERADHVPADVRTQMLTKLARRICKLEKKCDTDAIQYHEIYAGLRTSVIEMAENVRDCLNARWQRVVNSDKDKSELTELVGVNFAADTDHSNCTSKLSKELKIMNHHSAESHFKTPSHPPRYRLINVTEFPLQQLDIRGEENAGIALWDFSQYVQSNLEGYATIKNCQHIRELLEKYIEQGKIFYENDPVGASQMILTSLKILQVLDKITMEAHPLLGHHRAGVDVSIIKDLLLPKYADMKLAHELEQYFAERNRSPYPSLIEEDKVSQSSFATRYANTNGAMYKKLLEIQVISEGNIRGKLEEVRTDRQKCQELRKTAASEEHQYDVRTDEYEIERKTHSRWCYKCSLVREADNTAVNVYERPLPVAPHEQMAVIFELIIPKEIACLRDALYYFAAKVCSSILRSGTEIKVTWTNYSELSRHHNGDQQHVKLGSTIKAFTVTHYRSQHPEKHSDADFIKENGLNCTYAVNSERLKRPVVANIKDFCTFSIARDSLYKSLSWTVSDTHHSQNEVLAKQSNCHADMSLLEFKEFGSLRAGHRLQLRNIYRALQQDTLSFHREPVFSLICQAVWQAGPASGDIIRESHQDLLEPTFTEMLLNLLNNTLDKQSKNWTNYYTMLNFIVLTATIATLASENEIRIKALCLLLKCRDVTKKWSFKIEESLAKMAEDSREKVEELRVIFIYVSVCSCFTFFVDPKDIPFVLDGADNMKCWLNAIARIKDNVTLSTAGADRLPTPLRNLLRWVRTAGLSLEQNLHSFLQKDKTGLEAFVKDRWPGSKTSVMEEWQSCGGSNKQVYQCKCRDGTILHVDIVCGNFLVNGCPVGYLPESITNDPEYQRVFSNTIFEVQPMGSQAGILATVLKYHGCDYSFHLNRNVLVVTEIQQNGDIYQLIPHQNFKGLVSPLLVCDYSHWWCKTQNSVFFRPKSFSDPRFLRDVSYKLDLTKHTLVDVASAKTLINIKSSSFLHLCKIMERLEGRDYWLAFYAENNSVIVELPRMGLHFEIDGSCDNELHSKEYPGMKVSKRQKFGTFVGLMQGLMLESVDDSTYANRILLMPHGELTIQDQHGEHQQVNINLNELRKPEFFSFEMDERLRLFRAGQSYIGWLYLAYLHASTASPLPDPFTQLTGTEAALQLLNSPFCWSCQPLEAEELQALQDIAALSPKRKYYPPSRKCMEAVQWPKGLSSVAAHDSYREIVLKLVQDSQRLSFLGYAQHHDKKLMNAVESILVSKSHWRNRRICPELAQDFPEFYPELQSSAKTNVGSPFPNDLPTSVRIIAHLGHSWTAIKPTQANTSYLESLLITKTCEPLTGVTGETFCPVNIRNLLELNFKQSWLNLYSFAKVVKLQQRECDWTMLLSVLAFNGVPLEHLQLLHAVAVYPQLFKNINLPPYKEYNSVHENEFDSYKIMSIFEQYAVPFKEYFKKVGCKKHDLETVDEFDARKNKLNHKYDEEVTNQVYTVTELVRSYWPCPKCNQFLAFKAEFRHIKLELAATSLNDTLNRWYRNRELLLFLQEVESTISKLPIATTVVMKPITQSTNSPLMKLCKKKVFEFSLLELIRHNFQNEQKPADEFRTFAQSEAIFRTGYFSFSDEKKAFSQSNAVIKPNPFPLRIKDCEIGVEYMKDNKRSWDEQNKQCKKLFKFHLQSKELVSQLKNARSYYRRRASFFWVQTENYLRLLNDNFQFKILLAAGLFPKITPAIMLPLICDKQIDEQLRNLIGATAVLWTLEQRSNRCVKFANAGDRLEVALKKELLNRGHENWSPTDKPEWLLLELEMDAMIRPVQVEVANAMLQPQDNKHAVMQLNMGEGKTAVIIPMIIALLANRRQLCRVTVLKSLFHMNLDALRFKMGGLLNRRLYIFPCRRDMNISGYEASIMLDVYKECVAKCGIVLTLPEYRLSFQLKGYEKSRNEMYEDARPLLQVQQWLKENARDVLDESDEILHVKYQLVYTVGAQTKPGGKKLRWTVIQSFLELLPSQLNTIMKKYGDDAAECRENTDHPEQYPHCRILKMDYYKELCELLVKDVLDGKISMLFPDLQTENRDIIARFLSCPSISKAEHDKVMQVLGTGISTSSFNVILILRGLLACGVLSLVLSKRWRVNYGVNPNGHRLMAVPFRAKDVAAERTEFGHPDVAILCTTLSYYYKGLSIAQLDKCFERLYRQKNCDQEYKRWVSKIRDPHPSIQSLSGINLKDCEQREKILYPSLLKNVAVVNFYLDVVVFPKEAKQFERKMLCSPWDLCADDVAHPVTGFSGTNDTKLLLPLSISQKDLPSLLGTNGEVLSNLLQPENNKYTCLSLSVSSQDILKRLVNTSIPLLLDVGALMTDYGNQLVAIEWLKLIPFREKEAAVYVDENDNLVVIDRKNRICLLELSPFHRRMEQCLIYLDDFHTRGTDLKIPRGTEGCVTLGKGITKDKLVQGCMRMRMLGEGHTVSFLASKEVDSEIRCLTAKSAHDRIFTKDVLEWAMENSRIVMRDGFLHWSVAGFNHCKKNAAHFLFDNSSQQNDNIYRLGDRCCDKEIISLQKMYGTFRTEETYPKIARACLEDKAAQFSPSALQSNERRISDNPCKQLMKLGNQIVAQCERLVPDVMRLSYLLDEEQERELEHELEEECEYDRPPAATPADHVLDDGVKRFVVEGVIPELGLNTCATKLPWALEKTNLWSTGVQADCWGQNILASSDFAQVVKIWNKKDGADQFLRPPNWVAAVTKNNVTTLMLLSPFEVNELMPLFRLGNSAAVLHMFAARIHPDQDTLFNCPQLTVPASTAPINYANIDNLYANLTLFGGSLYFGNKHEQDTFNYFLGYILRPRTLHEQLFFEAGGTLQGFVNPSFRSSLPYITSHFKHNPEALIDGIINSRFEYFPDTCHMSQVIVESRKPFP